MKILLLHISSYFVSTLMDAPKRWQHRARLPRWTSKTLTYQGDPFYICQGSHAPVIHEVDPVKNKRGPIDQLDFAKNRCKVQDWEVADVTRV